MPSLKINIMHLSEFFHRFSAAVLALMLVGAALAVGALTLLFTASTAPHETQAAVADSFPSAVTLSPNTLLAKAAIIYDPTDGRILFAKDANESLPLASLTKLMTTQVVLANVSPNTQVRITPEDLAPGGDWNGGLAVGDTVSVGNLLRVGLIASSNDAITAAINSVGPDYLIKMNALAQSLGLSKTYFLNPTGLDIDQNTSGAYGSAFDIARLAAHFYEYYPDYLELTEQGSVSSASGEESIEHSATAAPILSTPGFIAAKTGYTDLAGGNLMVVFDIEVGHPLISVVLGSTEDGRFTDTLALINAARAAAATSTP
jgi:serine-type D-Ala-D-Ala carboxypeptidase (penicillin-binding protein 5/6)